MSAQDFFVRDEEAQPPSESFFVEPEPEKFSLKRTAQNTAAKTGADILSLPHTVLDALQTLKNSGLFGAYFSALPDEPFERGKTKTPSYGEKLKDIRKEYNIEEPQLPSEEAASNIVGHGLGALVGGPEAALATGAGQVGEEAAKAAGAPESIQKGINLATTVATAGRKAFTEPYTSTALERSIANNPEKLALYNFAKKRGMTDEQITPILQDEGKLLFLGKFGKRNQKIYNAVEGGRQAAGKIYDAFLEEGRLAGPIDDVLKQHYADELAAIRDKLSRVKEPSSARAQAIEKLDNYIQKVYNEPLSIDELINQDIDFGQLEWNKLGGKPYFKEVEKLGEDILKKAHPEIGQNYPLLREFYKRAKTAQNYLGKPSTMERLLNWGFAGGEIATLTGGILTGNLPAIASVVGTQAARRIAAKLVTDPKWQGLHKTFLKALKDNKPGVAYSVYEQMGKEAKKEAKNDDDFYWPNVR